MSSSDKPQLLPEEREGIVENETSSSDQPEEKQKDKATVSDRQSEKKIREDDDDGFKTPDHRIPAITQCPPAPKKPRPPPSKRKRKASSPPPGACRSLQFEASAAEVESLFRPISNDQDDTQDQKIKRARTEDDDHKEDPS